MLLASSNMGSFEILWLMHGALTVLLSRAGAKAQDVVVGVTSWASALAWHSLDVWFGLFSLLGASYCSVRHQCGNMETWKKRKPSHSPGRLQKHSPEGPWAMGCCRHWCDGVNSRWLCCLEFGARGWCHHVLRTQSQGCPWSWSGICVWTLVQI